MKHIHSMLAAACIVSLANVSVAQEKKLQRSELPPAVQKTVDEQSQGATVKGFSTEVENGKRVYEAEMMVDGHSKDIGIDASGALTEVEEEVPLASLPAEAKAGLMKKAGAGKLVKVETLTKHGKLVAYEADVATGSKKSEIQVGPDGAPLDHEE